MATLKPAGARSSKDDEKLDEQERTGKFPEPSRIALLHACMNFVGGVGRLLDLAAKAYKWWTDNS